MDMLFSHLLMATSSSLKWDEANLQMTEAEKAEFARGQISEPKTPYLHYDSDRDEVYGTGREALRNIPALDDPIAAAGETMPSVSLQPSLAHGGGSDWESSEDDGLLAASMTPEEYGRLMLAHWPCFYLTLVPEKHRAFREMRRKHYRMKESLVKARTLLQKEGLVEVVEPSEGAQACSIDPTPNATSGPS